MWIATIFICNILIRIGIPCIEQRFIGCVHETHRNVPCASIIHGKNSLPRVQNPSAALDQTIISNSVLHQCFICVPISRVTQSKQNMFT